MEDSDILELFDAGERDRAFNTLVRKYSERLYWQIRNMVQVHEDADDVLQNTWIKVWDALDTFRRDSSLYTWLYRIATNESITFLKKARLKAAFSFSDYERTLSNRLTADVYFSGDKIQLALQKAIATLPPKQKAVFTLRYFQELPYEQISEILETPVGSLKTSYHYAAGKVEAEVKKILD